MSNGGSENISSADSESREEGKIYSGEGGIDSTASNESRFSEFGSQIVSFVEGPGP